MTPSLRLSSKPNLAFLVAAALAFRETRASGDSGTASGPGQLPERLAEAAQRVVAFPLLAEVIGYEIARVTFAFAGGWLRPREDERAFTAHRELGWSGIAIGLALAMLVEALPVHVLVSRSHPALAWVLTGLTLYGLLWLAGDFHGLRLRPMRIGADALLVRVGLRWRVRVPLADIVAVRDVKGDAPPRRERGYLRATAFGDPSLIVELRAPLRAIGPYGVRREVTRIGLAPDEKARFRAALAAALAAHASSGR